ncbi:hypothetical protein J4449_00320 [Candidatus Woesearchaeota archaeon]|nr:hypothetical protein [Candidatus Woesearchaeota archaeon]
MGFLDFLANIGERIESLFVPNYSEETREIKEIYIVLKKVEQDLKNYNYGIQRLKGKSRKEMETQKLVNKLGLLSQMKKDINKILREF